MKNDNGKSKTKRVLKPKTKSCGTTVETQSLAE